MSVDLRTSRAVPWMVSLVDRIFLGAFVLDVQECDQVPIAKRLEEVTVDVCNGRRQAHQHCSNDSS